MKSCTNLCVVSVFVLFAGNVYSVPHESCLEPFDDGDCDAPPTPVFYYYKPGSRCEIHMWRGCPTLNKFSNESECSYFCIWRDWGGNEADDVPIEEKLATKDDWVHDLNELDIREIKAIDQILDIVVPANFTIQKLSYIKTTKLPITTEAIIEAITELKAEPPATQTEEPAAETTEAPAAETTEAPAVETTEAPAVETTEAPAVETTEAPAVETTEAPAPETTEATTKGAPSTDEQIGSAESVITTL